MTKVKTALKGKVVKAKQAAKAKRKAYMNGGKFISVADAQQRGWAKVNDGSPTAAYQRELERRAAAKMRKNKRKPRSTPPIQFHADIKSPYDLSRRSGYAAIWQRLAEDADKVVPWKTLFKDVNKRLAASYSDWYESKYAGVVIESDKADFLPKNATGYNVEYQVRRVVCRHPYNKDIIALKQEIDWTDEGAILRTKVRKFRDAKARGRKPIEVPAAKKAKSTKVLVG